MEEIYKALGWQGGTIHQVIDEIKRLKALEDKSCKGCIYNVEETGIWHASKCTFCIRETRDDKFKKRD